MKHWEKAYEDYMIADCLPDGEERKLLFKAVSDYAALERANQDFFEHPLYKKTIAAMSRRHEEELKELFQAGWEAHRAYLLKKVRKVRHRAKSRV